MAKKKAVKKSAKGGKGGMMMPGMPMMPMGKGMPPKKMPMKKGM